MPAKLDHVALNSRDPNSMLDFYCEVLGLEAERADLWRKGEAAFPSVRIDENLIVDFLPPEFMGQGTTWEFSPKHRRLNHICLVYPEDEWWAILDALQQREIPVEEGPVQRWGAHGNGTSVYVRDPENNRVELKCYPQGKEQ